MIDSMSPTTKEELVMTTSVTRQDGTPTLPRDRYSSATRFVGAALRLVLGWTFLWAFLDKLFGLGYGTPSDRSWLTGGSPTRGFLENSATGPFEDLYRSIAAPPGPTGCSWSGCSGLESP